MVFPLMAAASEVNKTQKQLAHMYTLQQGDTLVSLADNFGVPVDTLLAANPTLSALTGWVPGQSIVLPQMQALPALSRENSLGLHHAQENKGDWSSEIAAQASRLGRSLSGSDIDSDAADPARRGSLNLPLVKMKKEAERQAREKQMGKAGQTKYTAKQEADYWRQQVTQHFEDEASAYASNMLGGLGTARVKASVDKDFKLDSLDMDVLAVLQENPDSLTFTQVGLRRNDQKRTIANVGVGRRHFNDDTMLGYNAFLDSDLTRGHMRLGLGGEAWRDYTKFSANAYIPLSKWKDSPDFNDKEERAARGVDMRLQGFLPSHSQLSGTLIAEQYWGDNVDLMGSGRTGHNPRAFTAEVAYSPFPLLNVKVGHTEASGGQSNSSATLGLEWKLGASLSDMLNSSAPDKSLQGLRHDLVERNNNIVLEYRKKEVLKVTLPESFSDLEQAALPLTVTITHTADITDVTWFGGIFGELNGVSQGGAESVVIPKLPAFKPGEDNSYPIRVVVRDAQGHESQAEGRIVVKEDASLRVQPPVINTYIDDVGPTVGILNTPTTDDFQPGFLVGPGLPNTPKLYVDGVFVPTEYDPKVGTLTPLKPIPEGPHTLTYSLVSGGGNEGPKAPPFTLTFGSDVPPLAKPPVITSYADDEGPVTGPKQTIDTTDDRTPGFNVGTGLPNAPKLYVNGALVPTVYEPTAGTLTPVTPLTDGPHAITYAYTDATGNEGPKSEPFNLTVDNSVPPLAKPPVITSYADDEGSVVGPKQTVDHTDDHTPGFNVGTGLPNVPKMYVNGALVPTVYEPTAGTLTPVTPLTDGPHAITHAYTDATGNEGPKSEPFNLTIDGFDSTAAPIVDVTDITGELSVGKTLTGAYSFDANHGEPTDQSTKVWKEAGAQVGTGLTRDLVATDAGKVLTFEVTAKNGANVTGNTDSIDTATATGVTGGNIDPNHHGEVIDPTAPLNVTVDGYVNGAPLVGSPLSANVTCSSTCGALNYQWQIETAVGSGVYQDMTGATADTYTPVKGDQKRMIQVSVTH